MSFFPDPVEQAESAEPVEAAQPEWAGAPEDVLPGIAPMEPVIGRSESAAVLLTGFRAFPTGLAMTLGVRLRAPLPRGRDLFSELFDGPYQHDMDVDWQDRRLKWGFELADGQRVTNVDRSWDLDAPHANHQAGAQPQYGDWRPGRPVLQGGGGGGGSVTVEREYWLWPLPPAGRLTVACQWLEQGIDLTRHDLDATPFLEAATRAQPLWPPTVDL